MQGLESRFGAQVWGPAFFCLVHFNLHPGSCLDALGALHRLRGLCTSRPQPGFVLALASPIGGRYANNISICVILPG